MDNPRQEVKADINAMLAQALEKHRSGKIVEAESIYRRIIALVPSHAEAHYNLACALQETGKLDEACLFYERTLALQPGFIPAYINLGNALSARGQIDLAFMRYNQALDLAPYNTDAHYNLATALKDQSRFDEAITHYRQALISQSNHAPTHNNLGVLLRDKGDLPGALDHFRTATEINPDHAEAHVNEAMLLMLTGELAMGWKKYEWRLQMANVRPPPSDKPLWDGGALNGKTILLYGEQGFGDCIQFVRYAPLVKARGGRVVLSCPGPLRRLFESSDLSDAVVGDNDLVPSHDLQASLMSLPRIFGTDIDTVPQKLPYLRPNPTDVMQWKEHFGVASGMRVGMVWAGNARRHNPAANAVDQRRSMKLSQLAPLADIPGIHFVSLQKDDPAREIQLEPSQFPRTDYMEAVNDFADTAALIANLDLVIGVDTSVIHLAGALGKPVWMMSRFDGCWRWLLEREDSPWYPTLRLFRQPTPGDWQSVVAAIRAALMESVAQ